jgi:LL-diaminopimelate aminotransferase
MQTADRLNGIGEYYFSQKLREIESLRRAGKDIISLGIGSPDLPPHETVVKVLAETSARPDTHAYQSYKGSPVLRNAIADFYRLWYQVPLDAEKEILPLIGSKEGLMHLCMAYLNPGDKVLVPDPGYPTYRSAVQLAGGQCISYTLREEQGYFPDFDELDHLGNGVKMMFVNYTHMPTGTLATPELFAELVAWARDKQVLLVHDNPYSFILNRQPLSILSVPGAMEVAVELNSLSKSHNMAGWRIGMLCGREQVITDVLRFKSNMDSGMFLPLQLAAAKALELGKDWFEALNTIYTARQAKARQLLDALQCNYDLRQAGMFLWARIPEGYADCYAFADDILYRKQVFLTPGGIFGEAGRWYVRVSLCATEELIDRAIERIRS